MMECAFYEYIIGPPLKQPVDFTLFMLTPKGNTYFKK